MARTRMPRNVDHGYASVHTVKVPLWPYLVTPISAVAALPATGIAHWQYGASPWTGAVMATGGILVTSFTAWASRPRGPVMRATATGVAAASSAWVIPAVIDGPWSKGMIGMWAAGTVVMTVVVAAQRILRNGSVEQGDGEPAMGGLFARVKELKDARFSRATVTGGKAAANVVMPPGATFGQLADHRGEIASGLDTASNRVRMIPDPESERRGRIEAVPVDQLGTPLSWAGPSAPGKSIALPLLLGVVEDAEPLLLWLPGDARKARNASHVGVVGMSGAGKTEVILRIAEEIATRCDAEYWLGDARKADQLPGWVRQHAARVAGSDADIDVMLDDLLDDIPVRSRQMGSHGHKQWTEGCAKCPAYRVVILDEAASIGASNKVLVDLAEALRSVGSSLIIGLQRASFDRFPTSARSNIGAWICLGVQDADDAGMALSEETIKAGAMPWRWKAAHPGYLYAEVPGVPAERHAMQCRSFAPPPSEDDRAAAIAAVTGRNEAPPAPAAAAPVDTSARRKPVDDGLAEADAALAGLVGDDGPDDVDPSKPIAVPPAGSTRVVFDDGRAPMTPQEARDEFRQYLLDLADAGTARVRPSELGEVLHRTGLGGSWLKKVLTEFTLGSQPLLRHREHGYYEILVPEYDHAQ